MSERYANIRISLKGRKYTESVSTKEMDFLTWSKLMEKHGLDSNRIKLIADGRLIRDFHSLIFDNRKSNHTVNLMILATEGYDPDLTSHQSRSVGESRSFMVDHTAGVPLWRCVPTDIPSDRHSDSNFTQDDILIKNNSGGVCMKVLHAAWGTRRYRIKLFGAGGILQDVAEGLGQRMHVDYGHLIFIHGGKRYGAESFHVIIDDWPDDSIMGVMLNTNHWDDVERTAWRNSQILRAEEISRGFEAISRSSTDRAEIPVLLLAWKRDLEEIIENMPGESDTMSKMEITALLNRVQGALGTHQFH